MGRNGIRQTLLFIVLLLAQVLICNRIVLFGIASPIIFIYFIISVPPSTNRNIAYTLGFLLGLLIDIFSDTPGMNALACTILTSLRQPVMSLYNPHEKDLSAGVSPSIRTLGAGVYLKYLATLTLTYCTLLYCLEYFSFVGLWDICKRIIFSSLLSFLIMIGIDSLLVGRKKT